MRDKTIKKYAIGCVLFALLILSILNILGKYANNGINNTFLNKTIEFPDSLAKINFNGQDSMVCFNDISENEYKLICLFDIGCGKCINMLNNIDKKIKKVSTNIGIINCCYLGKNMVTDTFIIKYLNDKSDINLSFPVYCDINKEFLLLNSEIDINSQNLLLLLNRNNRILIINNIYEINTFLSGTNKYFSNK